MSHAASAAASSYWRSTFAARTSAGRSPASSNPPCANVNARRVARPGRAAATRCRSISTPTTRTSARTLRQPGRQLDRGDRRRAVAEVDDERVGGRAQRPAEGRRDPVVHAAQPVRDWSCRGSGRPSGACPSGGVTLGHERVTVASNAVPTLLSELTTLRLGGPAERRGHRLDRRRARRGRARRRRRGRARPRRGRRQQPRGLRRRLAGRRGPRADDGRRAVAATS